MTAKGENRDGNGRARDGEDSEGAPYPLLFKGSSRKGRRGLVGKLLSLFQNPPEPGDPEDLGRAEVIDPREAPAPAPTPTRSPHAEQRDRSAPTSAMPGGNVEPPQRSVEAHGTRPTPLHRATLQLLPGRLLPLDRGVPKQEIRFLRSTDRDHRVTVGRDAADPPNHVTVDHPSLEPRHALMQYRDGHWWIESLVADDPVRLNDDPIHPRDGRRLLRNGDRVRMGDVEFRFLVP